MNPLFPPAVVAMLFFATAALADQTAPATAPETAPSRFDLPATDDGLPGSGPLRRHDWFKQLWRERRTAWASQVREDQGALVFYGDSITQGWNERLALAFPGVKVANRGIGGDTSRGLLVRLEEDVLALNPSGVVLLIGTNDISDQAGPWTIAANVRLLITEMRRHNPAMPVVLCQVFPSSGSMSRPAHRIRRLNLLLREAVRDQPQVMLVDTWTLFATPEGDASPEEFPDLLHLNDAGYAKWAAALRPFLATLGYLETEPDDFTPEPGFISLFNGRDLTGWGFLPSTEDDLRSARGWQASDPEAADWPVVKEAAAFDGLAATPDGRFVAKNGRLVVTPPPEYRRVQKLWTTRTFPKNFVLKLEFRASPNADSGIYVRGPQLQCRDYRLAGPYTQLKNYRPQEWNELVITVNGEVVHVTCNGEVLEAAMKVPADGPIGLEGDRGQMEYRRIRIRELP